MLNKNLIILKNLKIEGKKYFQDLSNVEIIEINLLRKIILTKIKIMTSQEKKRDLILNLMDLKIKIEENIMIVKQPVTNEYILKTF